MKKKFPIEGLDCAHCAATVEEAISKLDGVDSVSVNFLTEKLIIEIEDDKFEETMDAVEAAATKASHGAKIIRK